MNRQVLLAIAGVVCLLAVAAALPSADPRIETSGTDWETVFDSDNDTGTDPTDDETDDGDDGDDRNETDDGDESPVLNISGPRDPTRVVTARVEEPGSADPVETPVYVDGEQVATDGESMYTLPFREAVTVAAPEVDIERTVPLATDARILADGTHLIGGTADVTALVGSTELANTTVRLDGTAAGTTDRNGSATVSLPEEGESVTLSVERGPVSGNTTLPLENLTVEFNSLSPLGPSVFLPGLPASVQVSAGGEPVANATITVDGETTRTDAGGEATVQLPISNAVTADAAVDTAAATGSATVSGLYLMLTVVVVVIPSLVLGLVVTVLRVTRAVGLRNADETEPTTFGRWFYVLGMGLLSLCRLPSQVLAWVTTDRSGRVRSLWSVLVPSRPLLSFGRPELPSVGAVGDLLGGSAGSTAGTDTAEQDPAAGEDTPRADDRGPDEQIRRHWHEFVAAVDIKRPETSTPGQVTRRALAAGYPAPQVRSLVATFRAVEYGGRVATQDHVERVQEACRSLLDHDPDSGGDA